MLTKAEAYQKAKKIINDLKTKPDAQTALLTISAIKKKDNVVVNCIVTTANMNLLVNIFQNMLTHSPECRNAIVKAIAYSPNKTIKAFKNDIQTIIDRGDSH